MRTDHDLAIRLTEWDDGWHWTVFDANPKYESGQVEGVLVPWETADDSGREPSQGKALMTALIAAASVNGKARVTVPLAPLAAWALICKHDHVNLMGEMIAAEPTGTVEVRDPRGDVYLVSRPLKTVDP
jgi:hypothetical protein